MAQEQQDIECIRSSTLFQKEHGVSSLQTLTSLTRIVRSCMHNEDIDGGRLELGDRCFMLEEIVAEREEAPAAQSNTCRHRVANPCTRALRFLSR